MEAVRNQKVSLRERILSLKERGLATRDIIQALSQEGYTSTTGKPITKDIVRHHLTWAARAPRKAKVLSFSGAPETKYTETYGIPHDVIRSILGSTSMGDDEKVLALKICYRVR